MLVELSPKAYLALCGLVRDALEIDSDASVLLEGVAGELMNAMVTSTNTPDFPNSPEQIEALRRGGFLSTGT